ncbi:hypothetical protein N0V82_006400 [Gnomoniopsis sp. IMI 355080]|nr:hypothetical protein N0V82_006400 [Gnomoniopsis sp. IMI 355080]
MSALQWTSLAQTITGKSTSHLTSLPTGDDHSEKHCRSLQSPNNMPNIGVRFVSDEVKRDHRELEILYKGLIQAVDECDDTAAVALQNQLSWELARHLVAMQLFVFPGTEQRAEEGNSNALRRRGDLATIRNNLLHLIDLAPSDPDFRTACDQLNESLKQNIRDVERIDLVAIEKVLDSEESESMARDWESAAAFLPGEGRSAPFATVRELLAASYGDVRRAWEQLRKERQK